MLTIACLKDRVQLQPDCSMIIHVYGKEDEYRLHDIIVYGYRITMVTIQLLE